MARRDNLGAQFDGQRWPESPEKYMSTEEIGLMRSANTRGRTSVAEWADALPEDDARARRINRFLASKGDVPGALSVSPDHGMLMDGHHRYKEARDAGVSVLRVIDNPDDPRFTTPN